MSDPISAASAFVSLLAFAATVVKQVFRLVKSVRDAPQQRKDLLEMVFDIQEAHGMQLASQTANYRAGPPTTGILGRNGRNLIEVQRRLEDVAAQPAEPQRGSLRKTWRRLRKRCRIRKVVHDANIVVPQIQARTQVIQAAQTAETLVHVKNMLPSQASPCSKNCLCVCHSKSRASPIPLPPNLFRVCSALAIGRSRYSSGFARCRHCGSSPRVPTLFEADYRFPGWIIRAAVHISVARTGWIPRFNLKVQRRVQSAQGDIFWHVRRGDVGHIREELRAKPAQVNYQLHGDGRVPLHEAIYYSRTDVILTLLSDGADYTIEDDRGADAVKKLKMYILGGRLPENIVGKIGEIRGTLHCDLSDHGDLGFTLLHKVVLGLSGPTLREHLSGLDRDALYQQLNSVDATSRTPLHWACERDDYDTVKQLIASGANIEARTSGGRTPLSLLASTKTAKCFDLLVKKSNPNSTFSGQSVIHLAATWGNLELVTSLINEGPGRVIDARCGTGRTPLMYASHSNHFGIVEHLLGERANSEIIDHSGMTALFYAVSENSHESLVKLLERGASCQHVNKSGETIWHRAARSADEETLAILVAHVKPSEVDLYQENNAGDSPFYIARQHPRSSEYFVRIFFDTSKVLRDEYVGLSGSKKEYDIVGNSYL
ncbi:hypothetical protein SCAR479_05151 [Seiridium cardinale]|uniref:Ankyrin n=1 Tax=Seiridium cardinale TaxID=138064 RepID=A0ABR2XX07_9PEZI